MSRCNDEFTTPQRPPDTPGTPDAPRKVRLENESQTPEAPRKERSENKSQTETPARPPDTPRTPSNTPPDARLENESQIETPAIPLDTPRTPSNNPPDAPRKEILLNERRKIDPEKIEAEFLILQKQVIRGAWFHEDSVKPVETILAQLEEYGGMYRTTSFKNHDDYIKNDKILQVVDMTAEEVKLQICKIRCRACEDDNQFPLQSRAKGSQCFDTYLDSWVLLKGKHFKRRCEGNMSAQDKRTFDLLALIYKICELKTVLKVREIYYTNTDLYKNTSLVGDLVNDICCMIGCTRKSLGISADEKGVVYGDVSFKVGDGEHEKEYKGDSDATGITIPSGSIHTIQSKKALFILVVEKDTILERLVKDGFCKRYSCIILTAKGMPDVITRAFLSLLRRVLKIPVFALVDCNPHGLRIYGIYRYGSKAMSYDRENLTTPDIQLLGIRYSDIDKYQIPKESMEKMTKDDYNVVKQLLKLDYMKEYHDDLRCMRDQKRKIQIEAFLAIDIEYFARVALPIMLQEKLSQLREEYILKCSEK